MATRRKATDNRVEHRLRFKSIRRLCSPYPPESSGDRLAEISEIALGNTDPTFRQPTVSADLAERLKAGQESRSPRPARDRQEAAQKVRKEAAAKKRGGQAVSETKDDEEIAEAERKEEEEAEAERKRVEKEGKRDRKFRGGRDRGAS